MMPAAIFAEYAAASDVWSDRFTIRPNARPDLSDVPLAAVLLYAIAEPINLGDPFTGDILSDLLGGLLANVAHWRAASDRGGGGVAEIEGDALRAMERRLDAAIEIRRRSRLTIAGGVQ
jgi:hypothetical protein